MRLRGTVPPSVSAKSSDRSPSSESSTVMPLEVLVAGVGDRDRVGDRVTDLREGRAGLRRRQMSGLRMSVKHDAVSVTASVGDTHPCP